jgi:peptidoglycan/xylan/chitin deacetylase (PgdA/CDA1 family)
MESGVAGRLRRRGARAINYVRRRARRKREAHGVILMYHRIASLRADPWELGVHPDHFESQIRALLECVDIVPLPQLRSHLRAGRRTRPAVAITFDDGYADNLAAAKPVLERFGAPATVFLATGYVGWRADFWWGRLANLVLSGGPLPGRLEIGGGDEVFRWDDPSLAAGGRRGQCARRGLHDRLWNWLSNRPDTDRLRALDALQQWTGASPAPDPDGWPMTSDQVSELVAGGLVEIGAHSVTHPMMSRLPRSDKAKEIQQSRADCRRLTGRDPACFAYPNGDLDTECVELVREAGFHAACTSESDLVWSSGDAFRMPRIFVRNEGGEALMRRLRWYWLA